MPIVNYLQFDHYSFEYSPARTLFNDFSLNIPENHWMGILGPSGVGKSTLLHAIADKLQERHPDRHLALLPQQSTLLPWLTVLDNVRVGSLLRGEPAFDEAKAILHQLGLQNYTQAFPRQLSGGQCQRVIIARTLYEKSDVVLMDEPFASLDAITKQEIQDCTQYAFKGKTVVLVTHDPLEALRLCHQIIVLKGCPVNYESLLELHSQTPRKLDDPEVTQYYDALMKKLQRAKSEEHHVKK